MTDTVLIGFGLGSNLGDRGSNLEQARKALSALPYLSRMTSSPIYETEALLPEEAEESWDRPFLNQVVTARCQRYISPEDILQATQNIERNIGRLPSGHWAPRVIDIDLLFLGDTILRTGQINVPHTEMLNRAFVMLPLADIAPDWMHPAVKARASDIVRGLSREGMSRYE